MRRLLRVGRAAAAALVGISLWALLSSTAAAMGGITSISASPVVTASSAYTAGNWVGGLLTFTAAGATGRVEEVTVYSKSAQTTEIDFWWCEGSNPTSTTITDKTAASLATADFNKCRVVAQLANWQTAGSVSVTTSGQIALPFAFATGTSGFGFLVTKGTPTFSSTSDLQVTLRIGR